MNQNDDDGILYLELCNEKGNVVASLGRLTDFPDKFSINSQVNFTESNLRNVYRTGMYGSVHIIVDKNNDLFQGNRSIMRACNIYLTLIPKLKLVQNGQKQSFDAVIKRFSHNLIKFQKRFKDNFDKLISDKSRARPYAEFKEEVKKKIEEDTTSAANDVCQMSHRALDLDAQIETLRVIGGYADNTGTPLPTNIKKAIYRLTNPFVDELRSKGINIVIDIDNEYAARNKVNVVHSLFNVAIWQLFDNICKYAFQDTDVKITAELTSRPQKIVISMVSVSIEEDERETIFLENRQGRNIKKREKSGIAQEGTGIGLYIVRKALGFMKAKIGVINNGYVIEKNGYPYSMHAFTIEF